MVLNLEEFSEMEIRPNLGVSCRRLQRYPYLKAISRALLFRKLVPLGDQRFTRLSWNLAPGLAIGPPGGRVFMEPGSWTSDWSARGTSFHGTWLLD